MTDVRCDGHVGEVHPPRCRLCESLSADYSFLKIDSKTLTRTEHKMTPSTTPEQAEETLEAAIDEMFAAMEKLGKI